MYSIGNKPIRFHKEQSFAPPSVLKNAALRRVGFTPPPVTSRALMRAGGFTLLELIVVVTIISSLVALSLPRFRTTFNSLKFDDFCQKVVDRMRYLRERAGIEQNVYRLNFDLTNKVIEIQAKLGTSGNEGFETFGGVKGLLGKKILIPENIEIETEDIDMIFYPDGTIDGKNILVSDGQNKTSIIINESMGQIRLQKDEQ